MVKVVYIWEKNSVKWANLARNILGNNLVAGIVLMRGWAQ